MFDIIDMRHSGERNHRLGSRFVVPEVGRGGDESETPLTGRNCLLGH